MTRKIRVIGVPVDLGQERRGVDMGPSAVRVAGLEARLEALGHEVEDGGNIGVLLPEQRNEGHPQAKYLKEITAICTSYGEAVLGAMEAGEVPVGIGGDHSIACGSISGVSEYYRRRQQRVGLIWLDAHSDINTPQTSPSGNVAGAARAARHLRLLPEGGAGKLRAGRGAGHRHGGAGKRAARRHRGLHHARHR